ncbi:DMT family transporter [Actinoallomurus sp. NPDC052308]|uniref:DMT family transporter n=1 Tax=Actinoallomurus sp. NPDC052308 TaxID=3155530 RepID=UPI0034322836
MSRFRAALRGAKTRNHRWRDYRFRLVTVPLLLLRAAVTAQFKLRRAMLAGLAAALTSLVCSGVAGGKLSAMGGVVPMGFATLFSGALFFSVAASTGRLRGKDSTFWWLGVGTGVASAATTVAFATASAMVPVGTVVPIMGLGTLVVMILHSKGRGWVFPAILTLGGFAVFLLSSSQGHGSFNGILVAGLGAVAQGTFTWLFQKAANRKEGMATAAITHPVCGVLLLGGAYIASIVTGHPLDWGWTDWRLFGLIALLGFTWMALPTLLNVFAASRLSDSVYAALQPLGSPISLLVQIAVIHQATSTWPVIANLLIFVGGVSAVFLLGSSKTEEENVAAEAASSAMGSMAAAIGSEEAEKGSEGEVVAPDQRATIRPQLEEQIMARYGGGLTAKVRAVIDKLKRSRGKEAALTVPRATQKTGAGDEEDTRP